MCVSIITVIWGQTCIVFILVTWFINIVGRIIQVTYGLVGQSYKDSVEDLGKC